MTLPLFAPGGVEIAIVLLVSLLLFSPIVALAYLVLFRPDQDDATAGRVDELEAEVDQLRDRLDDADAREDEDGGGDEDGDGERDADADGDPADDDGNAVDDDGESAG